MDALRRAFGRQHGLAPQAYRDGERRHPAMQDPRDCGGDGTIAGMNHPFAGTHRFQCRCGTLRGAIAHPGQAMRAVCYCGDCQAYAHVLGEPTRVLDPIGGTEVVATKAAHVKFTSPTATLACLSLSPKGLLRWYARCCITPIANTPRNWKLPYVGLVHTCLRQPDPLELSFPRVEMRVNTGSAKGRPPAVGGLGGFPDFARLFLRITGSRLDGSYKATPFFDATGAPVAEVVVTPRAEVDAARRAAREATGPPA